MKIFALILITFLTNTIIKAENKDSVNVVVDGITYTLHVGDSLQLGYGANPDGSFMYIWLGGDKIALDKSLAGKKVVISKIKYFKSTDQYWLIINGKRIRHVAEIPQAFDKKELLLIL